MALPCSSPRTIRGSSDMPALAPRKNATARTNTDCSGLELRL